MDPLSIAASSSAIAVSCIKISAYLYEYIQQVKNIDPTVSLLCNETKALSRSLDSIAPSLERYAVVVTEKIPEDANILSNIMDCLEDCRETTTKIETCLDLVQQPGWIGRSILRRPTKQFKLALNMDDLTMLKQHVASLNTTMLANLQMVNLCLTLRSNSDNEITQADIISRLKNLDESIHLIADALTHMQLPTGDGGDRTERQLTQCLRSARKLYLDASTVVDENSEYGNELRGGNTLLDPRSRIEEWIQRAMNEEPVVEVPRTAEWSSVSSKLAVDQSQSHASIAPTTGFQNASKRTGYDLAPNINMQTTSSLVQTACNRYMTRDYSGAEPLLRKAIEQIKPPPGGQYSAEGWKMAAMLGYCLAVQRDFDGAERLLKPLVASRKDEEKHRRALCIALHALALIYHLRMSQSSPTDDAGQSQGFDTGLHEQNLSLALSYVKRAVEGKKVEGPESISYFESVDLLITLLLASNEDSEADAARNVLLPNECAKLDVLLRANESGGGLGVLNKYAESLGEHHLNTYGGEWYLYLSRALYPPSTKFTLALGPVLILFTAAGSNNAVKLLVAKNADVNYRDGGFDRYRPMTPLTCASECGHEQIAQTLINAGAHVNLPSRTSETPLHFAAMGHHYNTMKILLSEGANVHAINDTGRTPLHIAIDPMTLRLLRSRAKWHIFSHGPCPMKVPSVSNCVTLLLDYGADPDRKDADGHSAKYYADCGKRSHSKDLYRGVKPEG